MMKLIHKSNRLAMVSLGACALLSTAIATATVEAATACPTKEKQKSACGDTTAKKATVNATTETVVIVQADKPKSHTGAAVKKSHDCGEAKQKSSCSKRTEAAAVIEASKQTKTENADGTLLTDETLEFQLLNLEKNKGLPGNSPSVISRQRLQSDPDEKIILKINGKTYAADSLEAAQEILATYRLRETAQSDSTFGSAPRTRAEGFGTHGIVDFRQLPDDLLEVQEHHDNAPALTRFPELPLKLVREKPKAMLGVMLGTLEPEQLETLGLNEQVGVLIAGTVPDTPAAAAGIEEGDIITAVTVNGESSRVNLESLRKIIAQQVPGTKMEFQILRNGTPLKCAVELAKWDDEKLGMIGEIKQIIVDEFPELPKIEVEEFHLENEDSANPHELLELQNNAHEQLLLQLKETPGISEAELEQLQEHLQEAFENFSEVGEQFHWRSEDGEAHGEHELRHDRHQAEESECRNKMMASPRRKMMESQRRKMMELRRPEMPQHPQAPRHPQVERDMPNFEMLFERLERRMQKFEQRMEQLLRQQRRLEQRLRQRNSDRKTGNTGTDA